MFHHTMLSRCMFDPKVDPRQRFIFTGHPQRRFRPPSNHPAGAQRPLVGRRDRHQSRCPRHDAREQGRRRYIVQHWRHLLRFRQLAPCGAPEQRAREERPVLPHIPPPRARARRQRRFERRRRRRPAPCGQAPLRCGVVAVVKFSTTTVRQY